MKYCELRAQYLNYFVVLNSLSTNETRDVCKTLMPPLHIHYRKHKPYYGHDWKLQIIGIFFKSKGHNSIKTCSILPKTKPDLDILIINLYIKYHFNMCNHFKEIKQKLQIIEFFQVQRP
jgi:hypothetical protein